MVAVKNTLPIPGPDIAPSTLRAWLEEAARCSVCEGACHYAARSVLAGVRAWRKSLPRECQGSRVQATARSGLPWAATWISLAADPSRTPESVGICLRWTEANLREWIKNDPAWQQAYA